MPLHFQSSVFSPVTLKQANIVLESLDFVPLVFFFDRVSPANIKIAKALKEKGTLIFFEPSCKVTTSHFKDCVDVSDIVKFADQRIQDITPFNDLALPLVIQTLGANGLQFKLGGNKWTHVPSIENPNIVDTSGAGDWATSAFINLIFKQPKKLSELSLEEVFFMLSEAQKLASRSCSFEGARGMMSDHYQ